MALFALVDAFAAKLVIGDTVAVIQEERPFLFSLFAHSRHWLAPFCGAVISCVPVFWSCRGEARREDQPNYAEWWQAPCGGLSLRSRRYTVILCPSGKTVFDYVSLTHNLEFQKMLILQFLHDRNNLSFISHTEPLYNFFDFANPLSGVKGICDTLYPVIRGSEICIATQDSVIVETAVPSHTKIFVADKSMNKLSIHTAARIIYDLF